MALVILDNDPAVTVKAGSVTNERGIVAGRRTVITERHNIVGQLGKSFVGHHGFEG